MDGLKNFLKALLYIGGPVCLSLVGQAITNKREQEVFELRVQQEVKKQLDLLQLPSGNRNV